MLRRDFLKLSVVSFFAGAAAQGLNLGKAYAAKLSLIDLSKKTRKDKENEAAVKVAAGLGYVEDLEKALKDKKIKKVDNASFKPSQQNCVTCQFYNEVEAGKAGTCTLIPNVLVHAKGSCNTWVKKS